ncbi:MAG: hypothetical protein AAGH15_18215 [Myxococcota bacterium]
MRVRLWAAAALATLAAIAPATAQRDDDGAEDPLALRQPERLTAGAANHFMGALARGGRALYFVGDDDGTNELYVQRPTSAAPRGVLGGLGDVAWPTPSPDGTRLAYVSFTRDATGDICVLTLEDGRERCLTDATTADLQAVWLSGDALGVLSREDLHGDFVLRRVPAGGGAGTEIFRRNVVGLAASPDGRWLAYVALEREREEVGVTFASRTARGLWLQRADRPDEAPVRYLPPLPGVTGYPTFGPEGRYLYFGQYLNDTNRDGVIDGDDNGVIVRVPFRSDAARPVGALVPEQLTSARWNCHYPAVTGERLVMTCAPRDASLDVYALPASGAVPEAMETGRLRGEIAVARDLWTKLLLEGRLLAATEDRALRGELLRDMAFDHVLLRELESAVWYTERLAAEAGEAGAAGTEDVRWAELMATLAAHRRADQALARGALSPVFVRSAREGLERVAATESDTPTTRALAAIVRSEILDDLGDEAASRAALEGIDASEVDCGRTLRLLATRHRETADRTGDREALLGVLAALSRHPALDDVERFRHAHAYVSELQRGRPFATREALLQQARERAAGEVLPFLLDVELGIVLLGREDDETVIDTIFALYREHREPAYRRALVLRVVGAASAGRRELVQNQFVTAWASQIPREAPERKYALALFRTTLLERAYGELRNGQGADAAALFFRTWLNTEALEAHVGFVETRLALGNLDAEEFYEQRFANRPDDPQLGFVLAYLVARELPALAAAEGEEAEARFRTATDEVLGRLAEVDRTLPRTLEVHHLWAYALHLRALRLEDRAAAAGAVHHYGLALDLARENPRYRAATLAGLARIQAALGNHYRAVRHFEARAQLPFRDALGAVAQQLAYGRSLFHAGRSDEAEALVLAALERIDADPTLAPHRTHALDRLGFYALDAGHAERARDTYRELAPRVAERPEALLKAKLGEGAAALRLRDYAAASAALDAAEATLEDAASAPRPVLRTSLVGRFDYGPARYRALLAGLRAEARLGLGDATGAREELATRRAILAELHDEDELDEDLLSLAGTYRRLAAVAVEQGDVAAAQGFLAEGLEAVAAHRESTGTEVSAERVGLVKAWAELHLFGEGAGGAALEAELQSLYGALCRLGNPRWDEERFRFQLYLTMLRLRG